MRSLFAAVFRLIPRSLLRAGVFFANAKFNHGVVGVFRDHDGRVLLLRHVFRKSKPWGFPSGFANRGEDALTAAGWELKEETGLAASDLTLGPTQLVAPRHLETVVYGRADSSQPITLSREIFEARWVIPSELDGDLAGEIPSKILQVLAVWQTYMYFAFSWNRIVSKLIRLKRINGNST